MKKEEKASISIMRIICVSIILILISGIGVMAVSTNLNDVKIVLQNGYEMTALTSKTKVSEILKEEILSSKKESSPISDGDVNKKSDDKKDFKLNNVDKDDDYGIPAFLRKRDFNK